MKTKTPISANLHASAAAKPQEHEIEPVRSDSLAGSFFAWKPYPWQQAILDALKSSPRRAHTTAAGARDHARARPLFTVSHRKATRADRARIQLIIDEPIPEGLAIASTSGHPPVFIITQPAPIMPAGQRRNLPGEKPRGR